MQKVVGHLLELVPDKLVAVALITHQLQKQSVLLVQELASVIFRDKKQHIEAQG